MRFIFALLLFSFVLLGANTSSVWAQGANQPEATDEVPTKGTITWKDSVTGKEVQTPFGFKDVVRNMNGAIIFRDNETEQPVDADKLDRGKAYTAELQLINEGDPQPNYDIELNADVSFQQVLEIEEASYTPAGGEEADFSTTDIFDTSGNFLDKIRVNAPVGTSVLKMPTNRFVEE